MSHDCSLKFIEHRVADGRILRLIQKWLKAGVSEDGQWSETCPSMFLHDRSDVRQTETGSVLPQAKAGRKDPFLKRFRNSATGILEAQSHKILLVRAKLRFRGNDDLQGARPPYRHSRAGGNPLPLSESQTRQQIIPKCSAHFPKFVGRSWPPQAKKICDDESSSADPPRPENANLPPSQIPVAPRDHIYG